MSKRGPDFQLTRFEHEQDRPELDYEPEEPKMASAEVLATRKLAPRPKARNFGGFGGASGASSNPFASFGSKTSAPQPAAPPAAASAGASNDRLRLIGLNKKFAQTIKEYFESNPAGSWAAACEKYLTYVKTLNLDQASPAPAATPSKPLFNFGNTSVAATPTPAAAPVKKEPEEKKPVEFKPPSNFTFGKPSAQPSSGSEVKFEPPKNVTFGGLKSGDKSEKKEEPKETEAPKPTGGLFGNSSSTGSTGFTFGKSNNEGSAPAPFKFGQSSEKPNFSFGQSASNKPFSFGANSDSNGSTPAPFKFGAGSDNTSTSNASKPLFNTSSSGETPKLSFGASTQSGNSAPKFTFGASTEAPKFQFGQPSDPSKFNVNSTWKSNEKKEEENDAPVEDDEPAPEPQQDFTGKGAGEESEDAVFEVRTKLYDAKNEGAGLGVLRVLVHRETKKSRVVIRADGSGRVLVNTIIPAAATYTANKNFVKLPVFGGEKPTFYNARVKTPESAEKLAEKLNEVKS